MNIKISKKCTSCNFVKSLSDFVKDSRRKSGYAEICKNCKKEKSTRHRKKNTKYSDLLKKISDPDKISHNEAKEIFAEMLSFIGTPSFYTKLDENVVESRLQTFISQTLGKIPNSEDYKIERKNNNTKVTILSFDYNLFKTFLETN